MVDRGHRMGWVDQVGRIDELEEAGDVGLEQALVERPREQVVVDPEENVALGIPLRQERPVDHLAGVAALQDRQLEPALLLERGLHLLGDREGVVRDEHDLLALARRVVLELPSPESLQPAATTASAMISAATGLCQSVTRTPLARGGVGRRPGSRPRP